MTYMLIWSILISGVTPETCLHDKDCSETISEGQQNALIKQLLSNYDKTERAEIGEQLNITIDMYIQGISSLHEVNMDYEVDLYFRQVWMDSRLAYGDLTNKTLPQRQNVDSGIMGQIWTPDLFFANEKNARKHTLLKENVFVEIASDGQVMISQSWLSFWIKLDIAPARVTFGIATFLTICEQTQSFNSGLPKVSYIKAIDIWMITCDVFVFATLLEYCLAQVYTERVDYDVLKLLDRLEQEWQNRTGISAALSAANCVASSLGQPASLLLPASTSQNVLITPAQCNNTSETKFGHYSMTCKTHHWLDQLSRRAFPITFALFNVVYWTFCLMYVGLEYPNGVVSIMNFAEKNSRSNPPLY